MEEMLRENCTNHQREDKMKHQRELKELIKRQEKQNRKEMILAIIVGLFITTISVLYIANSNNDAYKKCMNKNNNVSMCMEVYE